MQCGYRTKGRYMLPQICTTDHGVCEAEPIRPDDRRSNNKGMFGIIFETSHLTGR